MTSLQDILDRLPDIKKAAKAIGFSDNLKILWDCQKKPHFILIVEFVKSEKESNIRGDLRRWLTHLLQCSVHIETEDKNSPIKPISLDDVEALKEFYSRGLKPKTLSEVIFNPDNLQDKERNPEWTIARLQAVIEGTTEPTPTSSPRIFGSTAQPLAGQKRPCSDTEEIIDLVSASSDPAGLLKSALPLLSDETVQQLKKALISSTQAPTLKT